MPDSAGISPVDISKTLGGQGILYVVVRSALEFRIMGGKPDPERDEWVQSQHQKLGQTFAAVRKTSGFSQAKAAGDAGLARSTVDGVEKARGNPELETILQFAYALNLPMGDILHDAIPRLLRGVK